MKFLHCLAKLIGLICLSLSVFIGSNAWASDTAATGAQAAQIDSQNVLTRRDIERFALVMAQIHNYYIKPTQYSELFDDAIRGMLTGLDPHSDYLNKAEFARLKSTTQGQYAGIGVEVTPENGMIKVVSPFDDTPAAKAGIKPGDLIIRVNGTVIKNMSANEAIELIKGKPGSPLTLTIVRKGLENPIQVKLKRALVKLKSVKSKIVHSDVGYVRISVFSDTTAKEVKKALNTMNKKLKGNMSGVVLDLRNNPGGVLNAAIQTSNIFLDADRLEDDNQLIVFTKGRMKRSALQANVTTGDLTHGLPVVVLVNNGSASASEIVAGALQDHRRAMVLGTKSFGKGSVQTVIPIDKDTAIKLTTALYYTPSGRSIQASGIVPDVYVPYTKMPLDEKQLNLTQMIDESQLRGHISTQAKSKLANREQRREKALLAKQDFQLYQALNFLQGMRALSPMQQPNKKGQKT